MQYYYKPYKPKFFGVFCCGFASAWNGGNIEGGPGPGIELKRRAILTVRTYTHTHPFTHAHKPAHAHTRCVDGSALEV